MSSFATTYSTIATAEIYSVICSQVQGSAVLVFCGTVRLTPGLEYLGLQTLTPALKTWAPTLGPKSDSDYDSRTYFATY